MFTNRFEELKTLTGTYDRWTKAAGGISKQLKNFDSTKIDLLTLSEETGDSPEPTTAPSGSAAVADLIREVEQRASYQAGNPEDACEKSLYFLALGRPDIAERIASEVLAESPDNAIALYTNAVLLLDASERHQQQAFIHDIMHPHGLEPVEAEEHYHADRHAEESIRAWEKESQAFLLMLKARQNWPKKFLIKCCELSPDMWQHKVELWILSQAAARLSESPKNLSLPKSGAAEAARNTLRWITADIWKIQGRSFFRPHFYGGIGRFIIVAAHVQRDVARECLQKLEASLENPKPGEHELYWRDYDMVLPVPHEPTLAETLIHAVNSPRFCQAVCAILPQMEATNFLRRVARIGFSDEHDRKTLTQSLTMRVVVLNIANSGVMTQAIDLCREMAERRDWPATATGEKLRACWRYANVLLHFESSRTTFEANDIKTAAKHAGHALQLATDSLEEISGEKPLLKFIESDENGDFELMGDFLHRQPNIVTDTSPSNFFPPATPWRWVRDGHKDCWNNFVKWSEEECDQGELLLLAYGLWLANEHDQGELLPICNAFATKLSLFSSK